MVEGLGFNPQPPFCQLCRHSFLHFLAQDGTACVSAPIPLSLNLSLSLRRAAQRSVGSPYQIRFPFSGFWLGAIALGSEHEGNASAD